MRATSKPVAKQRWDVGYYMAWRNESATKQYPANGLKSGELTGHNTTDYFHFHCPRCGPHKPVLELEVLGVQNNTDVPYSQLPYIIPTHPHPRTVILGIFCPTCDFIDRIKIPCWIGGSRVILDNHGDLRGGRAEAKEGPEPPQEP